MGSSLCNYLSNIKMLSLKRKAIAFQQIIKLEDSHKGRLIHSCVISFWHHSSASRSIIWERQVLFFLGEGNWTHMSPSHQTKAGFSSDLCPEPADSGLSTEFPHYPEMGHCYVDYFALQNCVSKWRNYHLTDLEKSEWKGRFLSSYVERIIVLISIRNQILMNMNSDLFFPLRYIYDHFYKKTLTY